MSDERECGDWGHRRVDGAIAGDCPRGALPSVLAVVIPRRQEMSQDEPGDPP